MAINMIANIAFVLLVFATAHGMDTVHVGEAVYKVPRIGHTCRDIKYTLYGMTVTVGIFWQENAKDIVFVLDGSMRVKLTREKNFIISLLNKFDINTKNTNVGIVVYSSGVGNVISLQPFKGKELLVSLTRGLEKSNGGLNTNVGIKKAHDMMRDDGRPDAKKLMVVITKGRSEKPSLNIEEATSAKEDRILIIVVGVGENQSDEFEQEIRNIASNTKSVIRVDNFKELSSSVDKTIGIIEGFRARRR